MSTFSHQVLQLCTTDLVIPRTNAFPRVFFHVDMADVANMEIAGKDADFSQKCSFVTPLTQKSPQLRETSVW